MAKILVNIGNTHTQFGVEEGGKVEIVEVIKTSEILSNSIKTLQDYPNAEIVACSVISGKNEEIRRLWNREVNFLDWKMLKDVDFSQIDISTVGADRLANISAAVKTLKLPVIIVDCGTAITTEVIDEKAVFLGGAIIPGRKLMRQSLNDHTSQLPLISLTDSEPDAVGENTISALEVMDCAVIGAVSRILEKSSEKVPNAEIYFTGGDGEYFAKALNKKVLPKEFTLSGLIL